MQKHPVIAQSRADIDTAIATLDHERALRIPQPVAFAEYENQPDLSFWRMGFTVPIPLWNRRQGQISRSQGRNFPVGLSALRKEPRVSLRVGTRL